VTVGVRLCDLVSPLKNGAPLAAGGRSALVVAGTRVVRAGEPVVFLKVVAVAPAVLARKGEVRAAGSPCAHATLGPLEAWLDAKAGPGLIDRIAGNAVLDGRLVKGERERLLSAAFMIRVIVLLTLMPGAQPSDVITALAGDLPLVPWSRQWRPASERACLDWRKALGPAPLEELQAAVLKAADGEHAGRDGLSLAAGRDRPLAVHSMDGSLARVPDTPANRAAFGSVGTADGSSAWPSVRLFPLNNCLTRSLLAMPWGPAGTDKAAAEQGLLDTVVTRFPHVLTKDRIWLLDRLWHGVRRIRALAALTHVLVRVKSDIPLKKVSEILPDGSYRAEISGDGVTMTVRVIEYFVDIEGQAVPEMFCLITDLLDEEEYPALELAGLYKWRWDGSETGLREAKAPLHGAGAGDRGDAPLRQPGTHRPGDRGLGRRDRDDPRRHPRRRPRRAARPERTPRRAARPLPRPVPDQVPPPHSRRDPRRTGQLQGADQPDREIPDRRRPGPAPLPQVQVPQHVPARRPERHDHPHRPGRDHPGQHARLTSEDIQPARRKPVKPP